MPRDAASSILKVTTRSRPKRLAYLVDPRTATPEHLDKLIAYSTAHWVDVPTASFQLLTGTYRPPGGSRSHSETRTSS